MFDLEQRIRSWRAAVAAELGDRPDLVEELEGHLREEVERLAAGGKGGEVAWTEAVGRLGDVRAVAAEYEKGRRKGWAPGRVAGAGLGLVAAGLAWLLVESRMAGRVGALLAAHVISLTVGYAAVFAVGFLAGWAVAARAVGGWGDRQNVGLRVAGARLAGVALVMTGMGLVLGMWWLHGREGRWWGWSVREVGSVGVLVWSGVLWQCFRSRVATWGARVAVALVGNVVVAVSWFGPGLVGKAGERLGHTNYAMVLGAFVLAQVVGIYVSVLPGGWVKIRRGA